MKAGYLVDTNVISEQARPRPARRVADFIDREAERVFLSVLTIGELRRGTILKRRNDPDGAGQLEAWLHAVESGFGERLLPVDVAVAGVWAELSSQRQGPVVDMLLAATAIANDLIFVTRNVRDVAWTGVTLLNPWTDGTERTRP